MVLAEEAAVTEPAVGLGCILRSAWSKREKEDKEKQQHYIRANTYTSNVVTQQEEAPQATEEEEEEEYYRHVFAF